ncbi:MAG: hypothetical protein HQL94_11235 [Magnetococcales bacterium]|nr:hypothetical protein [Magnetococcales bacterium]
MRQCKNGNKSCVVKLLQKAMQGDVAAQWLLGSVCKNVQKDYVAAYKWWSLASYGSADTKKLDKLADGMTSAQIEEAQRLVQKWLSDRYPVAGSLSSAVLLVR